MKRRRRRSDEDSDIANTVVDVIVRIPRHHSSLLSYFFQRHANNIIIVNNNNNTNHHEYANANANEQDANAPPHNGVIATTTAATPASDADTDTIANDGIKEEEATAIASVATIICYRPKVLWNGLFPIFFPTIKSSVSSSSSTSVLSSSSSASSASSTLDNTYNTRLSQPQIKQSLLLGMGLTQYLSRTTNTDSTNAITMMNVQKKKREIKTKRRQRRAAQQQQQQQQSIVQTAHPAKHKDEDDHSGLSQVLFYQQRLSIPIGGGLRLKQKQENHHHHHQQQQQQQQCDNILSSVLPRNDDGADADNEKDTRRSKSTRTTNKRTLILYLIPSLRPLSSSSSSNSTTNYEYIGRIYSLFNTIVYRTEYNDVVGKSILAYLSTLGGGYFGTQQLHHALSIARLAKVIAYAVVRDPDLVAMCTIHEVYNYISAQQFATATRVLNQLIHTIRRQGTSTGASGHGGTAPHARTTPSTTTTYSTSCCNKINSSNNNYTSGQQKLLNLCETARVTLYRMKKRKRRRNCRILDETPD